MDGLDFGGRGVVVTGGTRGLGAAIAEAFRAAGAGVLVCARHDPPPPPRLDGASFGSPDDGASFRPPDDGAPAGSPGPAAPTGSRGTATPAGSSRDGGAAVGFFRADVRKPDEAAALVAAAVERFGRLDVVVNNAGGAPPAPAAAASPRLHAKIIELNLLAPLHVAQAANAVMQGQHRGGVILMIGSVSGVRPSPGTAAYGAAKAGLHHLATSLAMEWAPKVRVNSLVVGPVAPSSPDGPPLGLDPAAVARTVPLGRPATPQDVAGACLFLASPLAAYVTGAALAVHGGGEWPGYLADHRRAAYPAHK